MIPASPAVPPSKNRANSKAQLSMEAMLVLLVFIVSVGIAYFAVASLGKGAEKSISASLSKASFDELSSKIAEACSLGNGNVRQMQAKGAPMQLRSDGRRLFASAEQFSASREFDCEIWVRQEEPARFFTIANQDGTIEIS
ncbi:MAG: hypothetical protein N3E51_00545 [Candidatus Micrarchaeota archaeon]|nr:hypothetical protein [Candidatus Micrarchaeota archaeon]